jgi:hypothetical protein
MLPQIALDDDALDTGASCGRRVDEELGSVR